MRDGLKRAVGWFHAVEEYADSGWLAEAALATFRKPGAYFQLRVDGAQCAGRKQAKKVN
jgi:hypothetical protein